VPGFVKDWGYLYYYVSLTVNVTISTTSATAATRHSATAAAAAMIDRLDSLLVLFIIIIIIHYQNKILRARTPMACLPPNRASFHTPAPTNTLS
jgi:nitrogen fixation/metabolism regulation signal transduction histidine kinase